MSARALRLAYLRHRLRERPDDELQRIATVHRWKLGRLEAKATRLGRDKGGRAAYFADRLEVIESEASRRGLDLTEN